MKLSIRQVLSQSWEDFKKLIINPVVFILFLISSSLSILPDFIQEDTSPLFALLIIPLVLLMLFIYAYQVKLIYNLKTSGTQNIFSEVLSAYPRYLWYTIVFIAILLGIVILAAIPELVAYFTMGKESIAMIGILIIAVITGIIALLYFCIRLFFYAYLIILDGNKTPLATSWQLTKGNLWKLIFIILILFAVIFLTAFAVAFPLLLFLKLPETTIDIILLPLNALAAMYVATTFINAYLICRPQPVTTEIAGIESENQSI